MSLVVKNTSALIDPANFRLKMLVVGLPGSGKSKFIGTVPNIGVAACEDGHGKGLATTAATGGPEAKGNVDYVEPDNYKELETFCSGDIFKDKSALALDSLSAMARTFIKDYALTFPRKQGQTLKRAAGIPELDDYGVIGELTRRLLAKFINLDKHIIVTSTLKLPQAADPEEGKAAMPGMPDLAGYMALASPAMFDVVLILRTRPKLRNPKDANSRYNQRYFMTQPTEQWLAKSRLSNAGKPLLAEEEIFDLETGEGTFTHLLNKILAGYGAAQ